MALARLQSRHHPTSSGRSASERPIKTWFPRWQPQSVPLAGGMHRAGTLFATVIVNFQVVGHLLAAFMITQNCHVFGMMQAEELHR
jgi:ribosomal protein S19